MNVISMLNNYGYRFLCVKDKIIMTNDGTNYILVDNSLSFILPQTGEKVCGEEILLNSELIGFHNCT